MDSMNFSDLKRKGLRRICGSHCDILGLVLIQLVEKLLSIKLVLFHGEMRIPLGQ